MTFKDLPLELRTHILGSAYYLPDPADLARFRAVSRAMRDAVDATGREITEMCTCCAAKLGCLTTLQTQLRRGRLDETVVCEAAALGGQREILVWAREHDCPWDAWSCAEAARTGKLETLEWLRARGCPWDHETCASARDNGHLGVYDWARANGCPDCDPDDRTGRSKRSNELMETIERFFGEEEDEDDDDDDDDDDNET